MQTILGATLSGLFGLRYNSAVYTAVALSYSLPSSFGFHKRESGLDDSTFSNFISQGLNRYAGKTLSIIGFEEVARFIVLDELFMPSYI